VKQSICPRCGQPSLEGLCSACTLKSTRILSCPERVDVTVCPVCGAKLVKGRWLITERTAEELAYEATNDSLLVHGEIQDSDIDIQLAKRGATRYLARVRMKGSFRGISVEESCDIPVKIILSACDRCCRMAGKYFESTIQIRGSSRPPTIAELDMCRDLALSMTEASYRSGDQLAFVQDIKETTGGLDLIIGSTQLARQIARAIFERYGGRTQESAKLVGKKDGNDLYRTTILVRFPNLKRGDIISSRGTLFEVTGFDCRKTLMTSLEGDRKTSLKEEDVEGLEVLGNRADARKAVVVAKDERVLEILDPESYKTAVASRPRGMAVEEGDEVAVIRTGDGFIVLG
jgi:nonsense-mediated mRNA decay protein 3